MKNLSKSDLIKGILNDVDGELDDEEIVQLILDKQISVKEDSVKYTIGQKAADKVAKIAGSWRFIFIFMAALAIWIIINNTLGKTAFDPYPYILLNLALSCLAAIQAPLIMMSQNRQESKDRRRAENDYKVNLKTEVIIQDLYNRLDTIMENQEKILTSVEMRKNAFPNNE